MSQAKIIVYLNEQHERGLIDNFDVTDDDESTDEMVSVRIWLRRDRFES